LKIHWYIVKEVVPQFFSALVILSTILVVSQLVRLSEALVAFGVSLENILLPFLYIIVPFLSFNIPISYLAAVMLAFSRFSNDGEYAAMLASGFSLKRAAKPVFIIAIILYVIACFCAVYGEAWGRKELVSFYFRKTQTEVDNLVKHRLQEGVFSEDFMGYMLYAEKISSDRSRFGNLMIAPTAGSKERFTILAPTGGISGSVSEGRLNLLLEKGVLHSSGREHGEQSVLTFDQMEIDLLSMFRERILGGDEVKDDYRSYPPMKLYQYVRSIEKDPEVPRSIYYKARFLLHQRIATPFIVVIFACFGMVLGVTDPRSGKNKAYAGAIVGIIGGYVVLMAFKWFAEKGSISAPAAAWLPNAALLLFGWFLMYQKNRLPPSESPLDPQHIEWWVEFKRRWALMRQPVGKV
jgi:lipopolysaccharide export system permease protein